MHKLATLFALLLILTTGCSSPPQTADIDAGVNWALSSSINWTDKSTNLFTTYEITNQYTEKRADGTAYVYDYSAKCATVGSGSQTIYSTYTGSFTLMKKGNVWYAGHTDHIWGVQAM